VATLSSSAPAIAGTPHARNRGLSKRGRPSLAVASARGATSGAASHPKDSPRPALSAAAPSLRPSPAGECFAARRARARLGRLRSGSHPTPPRHRRCVGVARVCRHPDGRHFPAQYPKSKKSNQSCLQRSGTIRLQGNSAPVLSNFSSGHRGSGAALPQRCRGSLLPWAAYHF
jgi:hypothetical protein